MTRKQLLAYMWGASVFLIVLAMIGAGAVWYEENVVQPPPADDWWLAKALKDFAFPIVAVLAGLLAHILQRRSIFISTLREQWRDMVDAKAALMKHCNYVLAGVAVTPKDYFDAYEKLSRVIDSMRVVYRNVAESPKLVGLYPYEPLHDMRREFEKLDPRSPAGADARVVHDNIMESFQALREHFLDEIKPPEPSYPILSLGARRTKKPGAASGHPRVRRLRAGGGAGSGPA